METSSSRERAASRAENDVSFAGASSSSSSGGGSSDRLSASLERLSPARAVNSASRAYSASASAAARSAARRSAAT